MENVMVCVTQQKHCSRLIESSRNYCDEDSTLHVVNVVHPDQNFLNAGEGESEALEYLYHATKEAGGVMTVLRSENISKTLVDFAKAHKVRTVVLGHSPNGKPNHYLREMQIRMPHCEFIEI